MHQLRIAVVGAGPSGLVSAKYALQNGYECDVFEQTGSLGGNWVYNENTGVDEHGVEVQSSIYKDLVVNIPKEIMTFSDYSYPITLKESYITHDHVLEYHRSYAEKFGINKHIQYHTRVTRISPVDSDKWLVTVQSMVTKIETSIVYDCVFVCIGRFKYGFIPKIPGQNLFKGSQTHSHVFRTNHPYEGQNVLVVGSHHSGRDISTIICNVAKHVFISCREALENAQPTNLTQKPEIIEFTESTALFSDGSAEQVDSVIYCTGYIYTCTFLSKECGVRIENNGVAPLYKQIINIEHPTMFFIGIPYLGAGNITFDLQVRFAIAALQKKFKVPTKNQMLMEWKNFLEIKSKENVPLRHIHRINGCQESEIYSEDLAITANISRIPPVIFKLFDRVLKCNRARYHYRIVDDDTFEELMP